MNNEVEHIDLNFYDSNRKNLKDGLGKSLDKVKIFNEYNMEDTGTDGVSEYTKSSLKGFVQIHETNEEGKRSLIHEGNNLIVYRGRVNMLCRAFNKDLDYQNNTQVYPYLNMKNNFIAYFAVGTRGAATSNNQNPLAVNSTDFALGSHGSVAGSNKSLLVNGRSYMGFDDGYPKYIPEPEIINNSDIYNAMQNLSIDVGSGSYKRDSYLIANVQVTLDAATGNGTTGTQEISEAGLFLAPSDEVNGSWKNNVPYTGGSAQHLDMFARVCFPTITKSANRSFSISWYLFF